MIFFENSLHNLRSLKVKPMRLGIFDEIINYLCLCKLEIVVIHFALPCFSNNQILAPENNSDILFLKHFIQKKHNFNLISSQSPFSQSQANQAWHFESNY
jgi:hypothetical protein